MIRSWFQRRAADPLLGLLKQGLSPSKLAQCVAIGLVIAVFPALGVTTLFAALAALALRLNMLAIQTVNYLAYPLQFALIVPFYRAGARLFKDSSPALSAPEVFSLVRSSPFSAARLLWSVTWHASVVWAFFASLAVPALVVVFTPIFKRYIPENH